MLKSLKDISWLVDEPTYRADKALSYSTISKFKREGFEHLDTLFDKVESPSLLLGSLVDCLTTDPPEEYERIQWFSTWFTSWLSDSKRYSLIWNSIAINVLYEIFKSLFIYIKDNKKLDTKVINNTSNKSNRSKKTNLSRYQKEINEKKEKFKNKDLFKLESNGLFDKYFDELIEKAYDKLLETFK